MLTIILLLTFSAVILFLWNILPFDTLDRPRLQPFLSQEPLPSKEKKKKTSFFKTLAAFNKPLAASAVGKRVIRDLAIAKVEITAEEFFLIKEILIIMILAAAYPFVQPDMRVFWLAIGLCCGYMLPEFWLKGKAKKVKDVMIKELPDAIDLLGLCVNAGLDFMLALKWVIDRSPKNSVLVDEMNLIMQEINVGKTRKMALNDLAKKYDIPDLTTFSRTLIQADRTGTSVADALSILSEDMRVSRFRRGEQVALKAPMKMLIPLLLFIFPVVAILVAAPIFLDFMYNNPMTQMSQGISSK